MNAHVLLGEVRVGELRLRADELIFEFDPRYCASSDRPVLGWTFEQRDLSTDRTVRGASRSALPSFFRNALPEGALRSVLEARLPASNHLELMMLVHLGADLPGQLRVVPNQLEFPGWADDPPPSLPLVAAAESDPLRFSLAGVQLKASVLAREDRVTIPLVGESGDWIAKFQTPALRALPENEYTMLAWAALAGLNVPEHRLVDASSIENMPTDFDVGGQALIVKRFDRESGDRVHQEDFAQVFDLEPESKYHSNVPDHVHYSGIAAIVAALCGRDDLYEFVQRVAFSVLCGNGDAHIKNWSLIYPDRIRPRLSPLYDYVSTVVYEKFARGEMALAFAGQTDSLHYPPMRLQDVTLDHFHVMADMLGEPSDDLVNVVKNLSVRARKSWAELRGQAPPFIKNGIDAHLRAVKF